MKTMLELRRLKLMHELSFLGYRDIKSTRYEIQNSDDLKMLRKSGEILENYYPLGMVYRGEYGEFVPARNTKKASLEEQMRDSNFTIYTIKEYQQYKKEEGDKIETMRCVPGGENFLVNMRDKIPEEDWYKYVIAVRKVAETFVGINRDIVPDKEKGLAPDLSIITTKMELDDIVSKVIDSKWYAEACIIEDEFIKKETEQYMQNIDFLLSDLPEDEKNSSIGKALISRRKDAENMYNDSQLHINKYSEPFNKKLPKDQYMRDEY